MKLFLMTSAAGLALIAGPAFGQQANPPANATPPADAQAAAPGEPAEGAPADIVVTAQKRTERLQDVPVAVSVVSGDALASQGKVSIEGAAALVPTLNFQKSGTTLNQSIFLRGVGTATFSIAGEPSVSTVVDGVVYSRSGEAFGELVDIERMEVLRGPQGTLFGKNASAGVINIVSKRPTKEFGGYVEAGYYTNAEYRGRAVLNVPFGENLLTRWTGFYTNYDGNIRNVTLNRIVNGFEHYGGRVQALWTPSSIVTVNLIADYHHNNDDCCADVIATPPVVGSTGAFTTGLSSAALPPPRGSDTRSIAQDYLSRTVETGYGFSGQIDVDLAPITVTSITAYRNWKNTEIADHDYLPAAYIGFPQVHDFGPQIGDTFSQELRFASQGKNLIDYTFGFYYSRAYSERTFTSTVIQCTSRVNPAPTTLTPCSDQTLANAPTFPFGIATFGSTFKNLAAFGQATLNISDQLRFIGGLRFTVDQLDVFHSRNTTLAGPGIQPSFPVTPTGTGQPASIFTSKATNTNLSGKAGVQFDISRRVMAYGTYARGYKGPAFNIFYNLTATGTNAIAPETSDAFEIGLKNTLFNGHLVLNLAAYYAKYRNFQANNPDIVAGVVVTRFTNAGTVSTRGAEADLLWQPVRDLSISGGLAYTDAHVDQFNVAPGAPATAIVPAGTPLGFAPKWKGSLAADYRWRTGSRIDPFFGVQGNYQSSQLAQFSPDPVIRRLATIPSYGIVNLSAGIADSEDHFRITGVVRNAFDKSYAAAIVNGGPDGAYRYQIPRDADRYYGVTARLNF